MARRRQTSNTKQVTPTRTSFKSMHTIAFVSIVISLVIDTPLTSLFLLNVRPAAAAKCDFEQYATGCYAAANFICDAPTNECKCHHEVPVLIDQRWCVKRSRYNQICQYNQQCDNSNGLYCLYSDYKVTSPRRLASTLTHFNERYPRCRCKSNDYVRAFIGDNDNEVCVHRSKYSPDTRLPAGTHVAPDNLRPANSPSTMPNSDGQFGYSTNDNYASSSSSSFNSNNQNENQHNQTSKSSRPAYNVVWYIFIFITSMVLIVFVAVVCCNKRTAYSQSLQNMEPPPYEEAIKY